MRVCFGVSHMKHQFLHVFGEEDINIPEILYLLQFLHHFLDAQISAVAHLVLHLSQPITELFVLVVEDGPGIEAVCDFLPAQGYLGRVKVINVAFSDLMKGRRMSK